MRITAEYPFLTKWFPPSMLAAGLWVMEALLHDRNSPVLDLPHSQAFLGFGGGFWEAAYGAGFMFYFSPLFVPVSPSIRGLTGKVFLGFVVLLGVAVVIFAALPDTVAILPCLNIGVATYVLLVSFRVGEKGSSFFLLTALSLVGAATLTTQRHQGVDVLAGFFLGLVAYRSGFPREAGAGILPPLRKEQVCVALAMAVLLPAGFYATNSAMASMALAGEAFWRPALPLDHVIPFDSRWVWIYFLYFPGCFIPLLFRDVRRERGTFRRTALGFCLQFAVGLLFFWIFPSQMLRPDFTAQTLSERALAWFYGVDPGFNVFPSLHVANAVFVACLVRRVGGKGWGAAGWGLSFLIAVSTVMVKQHYTLDVFAGIFLGVACFRIVFWNGLGFLEREDVWEGIAFHLKNIKNTFVINEKRVWETMYAAGQWEFLDAVEQRPRFYVIRGMIEDRFPDGARILDVGCGEGTLFPLVEAACREYTGMDISETAVAHCRAKFGGRKKCGFIAQGFDSGEVPGRYDVVVLNEVLYYFPFKAVGAVLARARSALRNPDGLLIVSMNKNLKGRLMWRRLDAAVSPVQALRVENRETGSYWTVKGYARRELERRVHKIDTTRLSRKMF